MHLLRRGPQADNSSEEYRQYGSNRLARGKLPACAEMCATKSLLAGDADVVADIYRERVAYRGATGMASGWGVAYGKPGVRAGRNLDGKAVGKD